MSDEMVEIEVNWDLSTDEYPEGDPNANMPDFYEVPAELIEEFYGGDWLDDPVADWLSDETGWFVMGWGERE